jgi:hypothetical protein
VIGQFATVKFDFQHFAECCPLVQWDESENVIGDDALLVCHLIVDADPIIEFMLVAIDVVTLGRGSGIFWKKISRMFGS